MAEVDMLENVEIGEQKCWDKAYKAAKKKMGINDDKFIDDPSSEKKILMQYDDLTADEARLTPTPLLPRSLSSFP